MIYQEGFIINLNLERAVNAFEDELYSKVKLRDGSIINFNSRTKISGCKFQYLKVGDRVLIRDVKILEKRNKQFTFITSFEIIDLERKWEDILKNDKKIKDNQLVLEYDDNKRSQNIITPIIFDEESNYVLHTKELIGEHIHTHKFRNPRYEQVMTMHYEGKSLRQIRDATGYSSAANVEYVIKRHYKLWGIE